ncbi:MAG: phosphate/phosphite/phosphonate ABC transporter substrate-binding protein [Cyanobacteria bacterium P01_D01_bin.156]
MKTLSTRRFHQIAILMGLFTVLMVPLASCSSNNNASDSASASDAADRGPDDAVQVGVLVIRDIEFAREQYGPILDYLSEQVGRPFVLVPVAQESQFLEVEGGRLDFIISNPLASVQMRRLYGTELIVTQSQPNTGTQLAGQIIVKSDSDISSIQDLKGRNGACVSLETAAAGCLFQTLHVQQNDVNPFLDFGSLLEISSQNNIVLSVINGEIDFGFVRTGQIETMVNSGLLADASQVRVLEPKQEDGFIYEHTTRLYPTWPVAATGSAPPALVESVKQALLNMPPDSPALEAANLESFVSAADYAAVDQLISELQLRSWDAQ